MRLIEKKACQIGDRYWVTAAFSPHLDDQRVRVRELAHGFVRRILEFLWYGKSVQTDISDTAFRSVYALETNIIRGRYSLPP